MSASEKLKGRETVLLDGGFSSTAAAIGGDDVAAAFQFDPLWTSALIRSHPQLIKQVHKEFILAGAEIISTATYQATLEPPSICKSASRCGGMRSDELQALLHTAVELAQVARSEAEAETSRRALIAGSVGPLGAALCNGAEYDGRYLDSVSFEVLYEWHQDKVASLVRYGCDLIAFETFPGLLEALACVNVMRVHFPDTPFWLSFSVSSTGDTTARNESFDELVDALLIKHDGVHHLPHSLLAIGVNCAMPRAAGNAVQLMRSALKRYDEPIASLPLIAYPNGGFSWDTVAKKFNRHADEPTIHECFNQLLDFGVRYIGGCCTTTHEDIRMMRNRLDSVVKRA